MNLRLMHRYFNGIFFLIVCLACANGSGHQNTPPVVEVHTDSLTDNIERRNRLNRDSLYSQLIDKLETKTHYAPVIRFLLDSLVPQYNEYEYARFSDFCLAGPRDYLTQMKLNGLTLVTLDEDAVECLHYFLLNPSDSIVWHHSVDVLRTSIQDRTFRDWDGDGEKEIVEHRQNIVSGFVGTTEYVFSVEEKRLKLLFYIELSVENYINADSQGFGHLTRRDYKGIGKGMFYITQRESKCDKEGKPHGKISTTHYTISSDSLIKIYSNNEN